MKIFNQNAEILLFEQARYLANRSHSSWRCIYFNLAMLSPHSAQAPQRHALVGSLRDLLQGTDCTLFHCEDGDVFILFEGAALPILRRLGSCIEELRPEHILQPRKDNPFLLFDLGLHWPAFYAMCRLKYMRVVGAKPDETPYPLWRRHAQVRRMLTANA